MENDVFNDIFDANVGSNYLVIGKTGAGKTALMSAILEQCVTRIAIGNVTEFKLPKNKGKGKRRGKK